MSSARWSPAASVEQINLRSFALAAIASGILSGEKIETNSCEMQFLERHLKCVAPNGDALGESLKRYLASPADEDLPLLHLAGELQLNPVELLAVGLVLAVESEVMAGRVVAHVQAPLGGSRPTLGLLASCLGFLCPTGPGAMEAILNGAALSSGLIVLLNDAAPLAEQTVSIPAPLCLSLSGHDSHWPGTEIGMGNIPEASLPESILGRADAEAAGLREDVLVVRTGSVSEARSVACAIARPSRRRAVFVQDSAVTPGFVPWLILGSLLPVFSFELGPGEKKTIPTLPSYIGPRLGLCGPDGVLEANGETPRSWTVTVPPVEERRVLWRKTLIPETLADDLATHHRHGCGRIAHLARLAHRQALVRGAQKPEQSDLIEALWTGEGAGLEPYAHALRDRISEEALVMPALLRQEMQQLYLRCRSRDGLVEGLGASSVTRYRPGVRALFVGPSGTGKTLAAGWLATRLGLPLYRVDLASVTSKYIGETEKNLATMLARAENAEVVLLFDEADSLFAKRTDVKEANDRFANAQTNYLLQRIETFDGITILTSNTRARFDSAFARRLDLIVEFPLPGPEERRALWKSHLGDHHTLTQRDLNQLAATADICGGNIRNAVLAAAVLAHAEERPIEYGDLVEGLAGEYRKLGRQMPMGLRSRR